MKINRKIVLSLFLLLALSITVLPVHALDGNAAVWFDHSDYEKWDAAYGMMTFSSEDGSAFLVQADVSTTSGLYLTNCEGAGISYNNGRIVGTTPQSKFVIYFACNVNGEGDQKIEVTNIKFGAVDGSGNDTISYMSSSIHVKTQAEIEEEQTPVVPPVEEETKPDIKDSDDYTDDYTETDSSAAEPNDDYTYEDNSSSNNENDYEGDWSYEDSDWNDDEIFNSQTDEINQEAETQEKVNKEIQTDAEASDDGKKDESDKKDTDYLERLSMTINGFELELDRFDGMLEHDYASQTQSNNYVTANINGLFHFAKEPNVALSLANTINVPFKIGDQDLFACRPENGRMSANTVIVYGYEKNEADACYYWFNAEDLLLFKYNSLPISEIQIEHVNEVPPTQEVKESTIKTHIVVMVIIVIILLALGVLFAILPHIGHKGLYSR